MPEFIELLRYECKYYQLNQALIEIKIRSAMDSHQLIRIGHMYSSPQFYPIILSVDSLFNISLIVTYTPITLDLPLHQLEVNHSFSLVH